MKNYLLSILAFVLLLVVSATCKSEKLEPNESAPLDFLLMDSTEAALAILDDEIDGFFDAITKIDMSIQMKKPLDNRPRTEWVKDYKAYLQKEVSSFSPDEQSFMQAVLFEAKKSIDALNASLWPIDLMIGKIKTNHYGPSVYYTRNHSIFVPDDIFEEQDTMGQMSIMLHEIYHILSRYHHDFKNDGYALIGFEKIDQEWHMSDHLKKHLLTNPDGTTMNHMIRLTDEDGGEALAIPLIVSNQNGYQEHIPSFFSYLSFDLFKTELKSDSNVGGILSDDKGKSTLSMGHQNDFFRQIKDNTQYIIHPDEIMADNFMLAVIAYNNGNYDTFSTEGNALIMDFSKLLKSFTIDE